MTRETRTHFDMFPEKTRHYTRCGIEFWRLPSSQYEGDTVSNRRVHLTDEPKQVTCKRCRNGMQADLRLSS